MSIQLIDALHAHRRIRPFVHQTPCLTSGALDQMTRATLHFKCENFQKSGSFKMRGALNSTLSLNEEQARHGIVAHSAGNHGGALALAGQLQGIKTTIVVPEDASRTKLEAIADYGARIISCAPTWEAREATVEEIVSAQGATYIHPVNQATVMAGQGTVALEILHQCSQLDAVVIPVGGGGLISGMATVLKEIAPEIEVIGVEPTGASSGARSFETGRYGADPSAQISTIADGLAAPITPETFSVIRDKVDRFLTVSDRQIEEAMILIWTRMKMIVEPAAAAALAAVMSEQSLFAGQNIALVMTGGNVDLKNLPWS
ncbi:threonine/serine dehydratase [Pseudomaricurvus alkylphenolicus]|uniref:threonine ammonia-lyase n=1 Tax=Pseudomaricurvus alkylphenolicus TaxID=1306991 RepID=UPI001420272C|nr:threonine/serine dehydratase [Pseudomaricurvus alkylphenolicus]NIB42474.1 threonine/serine dehydratase [Pseudomaricurvus alkylphenolicus]